MVAETAKACASTALVHISSAVVGKAITTRGKKEKDHYIINGTKFFITSAGEADVYLVFVRTNPEKGPQGMTTLLVEKDAPGLSFGRPEDKMGLTSTCSRELHFDDCRIPVENLLGKEGEGMQVIGRPSSAGDSSELRQYPSVSPNRQPNSPSIMPEARNRKRARSGFSLIAFTVPTG